LIARITFKLLIVPYGPIWANNCETGASGPSGENPKRAASISRHHADK